MFDDVVEQVRVISGYYQGNEGKFVMKTPSYAIQVGNTLKRCANVVTGLGIRRKDKDMRDRKFYFHRLNKLLPTSHYDK